MEVKNTNQNLQPTLQIVYVNQIEKGDLTNLIKFLISHLQRKNLIAPTAVRLIELIPIKENLFIFVKVSPLSVENTCFFFCYWNALSFSFSCL